MNRLPAIRPNSTGPSVARVATATSKWDFGPHSARADALRAGDSRTDTKEQAMPDSTSPPRLGLPRRDRAPGGGGVRMPETIDKTCKCCGAPITVRLADHRRGWGNFCSKSCKAREQERRTHQNRHYREGRRMQARERVEDGFFEQTEAGTDGHKVWTA